MSKNRRLSAVATRAVLPLSVALLALGVQPAAGISLGFAQHRPFLGFQPSSARSGDVDGDGIVDLIVLAGSARVLRGNGDGSFQAPWTDGVVTAGVAAVGDLNGDRRADLAVARSQSGGGELVVRLGRADGTLSAPAVFRTSRVGWALDIAMADLNRDGHADVVMPLNGGIANWAIRPGTTIAVMLGDGRGGLRTPVEFPAGRAPVRVAVADFNRDGNPDLVVTNWPNTSRENDTVSVLLGSGGGTFAPPRSTPLFPLSGPFNMVAADLDGDGRQDVAVAHTTNSASNGLASVLLGNGDGSFRPLPRFRVQNVGSQGKPFAAADFNRDGLGDLALPGFRVCMQKREPYGFSDDGYNPESPQLTQGAFLGNGLFGLAEWYAMPSTIEVSVADFDGDGWSDVAVIGQEGSTRVLTVLLNRTASMPEAVLASVTLEAEAVDGGTTSRGTVTLTAPAPPGGVIVELASTRPFLITGLPAAVAIPEGEMSAGFSFRAARLNPDFSPPETTATVIGQLRQVTRTAPITVFTPQS